MSVFLIFSIFVLTIVCHGTIQTTSGTHTEPILLDVKLSVSGPCASCINSIQLDKLTQTSGSDPIKSCLQNTDCETSSSLGLGPLGESDTAKYSRSDNSKSGSEIGCPSDYTCSCPISTGMIISTGLILFVFFRNSRSYENVAKSLKKKKKKEKESETDWEEAEAEKEIDKLIEKFESKGETERDEKDEKRSEENPSETEESMSSAVHHHSKGKGEHWTKNEPIVEAALEVRRHAYCPYSKFCVGAAVRAENGQIYSGCNVENAAYQGTCAESGAIAAMIAAGQKKIIEVIVVGGGDTACTPCGGCRQRIREFANLRTLIRCFNPAGKAMGRFSLGDLLPNSFSAEHLL